MLKAVCKLNNIKRPKLQKMYKLNKSTLLYPEGLITLNKSASEIITMCDGSLSILEIKNVLIDKYSIICPNEISDSVDTLLLNAFSNNWIIIE
jgi:pyrroloquinoline quinone biosynthesis protein D